MSERMCAILFALASVWSCASLAEARTRPHASQRHGSVPSKARRYPSKVVQEEFVSFHGVGKVRVRALETPRRLPRLEFTDAATGRMLLRANIGTSEPLTYIPEPDPTLGNPFVRFMAFNAEGLESPLILAVAVSPGGSDHSFESNVIGVVRGRLKVLTSRPLHTPIQGGVFVGDLGGGRGVGAAVWSFLWEDGAHYSEHRYEVELYPLDRGTNTFRRSRKLRSKLKHDDGAGALEELGLPRYLNLLDNFPAIKDYRE